ncbi:MAG: hypothetical protein KGL39_32855 [Patescibacteria group bacterium]|nr:hypothetical protein [Patescibacteria group bacterium]
MKVQIFIDEKEIVEVDNHNQDNIDLVTLVVYTQVGKSTIMVPIDEMMSALIAFDSLRSRKL